MRIAIRSIIMIMLCIIMTFQLLKYWPARKLSYLAQLNYSRSIFPPKFLIITTSGVFLSPETFSLPEVSSMCSMNIAIMPDDIKSMLYLFSRSRLNTLFILTMLAFSSRESRVYRHFCFNEGSKFRNFIMQHFPRAMTKP